MNRLRLLTTFGAALLAQAAGAQALQQAPTRPADPPAQPEAQEPAQRWQYHEKWLQVHKERGLQPGATPHPCRSAEPEHASGAAPLRLHCPAYGTRVRT